MNLHPSSTEIFFRSSSGKPGDEIAEGILLDEEKEMAPEDEELIFCRKCRHIITRPVEAIQVSGQHLHTFANPNGQIFEIGCFQMAEGCGHIGQQTAEWSWFKGFSWKVAVCGRCLVQMGWTFISSKGLDNFHGLILERLVFPKG
ncbi:MAG: hypothetical protein JRI61_05950 [Deltaproteobacteria bacterium]|nr:hypothetical protein [Deltaproteobacteria bacterium]